MAVAIAILVRIPVAEADENSVSQGPTDLYERYEAFKDDFRARTNIDFSLTTSAYVQAGTPRGGPAITQFVYSPAISWAAFSDTAVGSGTFNFAFQYHHFLGHATSATQQESMGLLTTPNDWLNSGYEHDLITYTHTMPGSMKWLSITIGQYGLSNFDGNEYTSGPQTSFIGLALAQNATQTYATAGLGSYVQAESPDGQFLLAGGFQSGTDIGAELVDTRGFASGRYAYFVSARWAPRMLDHGSYGILWYNQPSVPLSPSASHGVSFSASQEIAPHLGLFLRVNNASGAATPIQTSVAWGGIYDDPFRRNSMDQFGLGFFWNKTNHTAAAEQARDAEWGSEIYYNYTIGRGFQVTPDAQVFFNPAFHAGAGPAAVFTVRGTAFF